MNFWEKERLILRISGSKRRSFSTQEIDRKIIIPQFLRNLHDVLWNEKVILQSSKKNKQAKKTQKKRQNIFFRMEYRLLIAKRPLFWILWGWKTRSFWAKTLMEIWYILITGKFLVENFLEWKIQSFLRQKVVGKMIFPGYWKVLVSNILKMKRWKDHIYWLLKCSCFELQKSSCLIWCQTISVIGKREKFQWDWK